MGALAAQSLLLGLVWGCQTPTGSNGNANSNGGNDNLGGGGQPDEVDRVTFAAEVGFEELVTVALGSGDFDGDGRPDAAIVGANSAGDEAGRVNVSLNDGAGAFPTPTTASVNNDIAGGAKITVADLDGTNGPDLIVVDNGSETPARLGGVLLLFNQGAGAFSDGEGTILAGSDAHPIDAEAADVNGDGRVDLLILLGDRSDRLNIYPGNGDGTFGAAAALTLPAGVGDVALADFDGDSNLDIAMSLVTRDGSTGLNQAGVLFGDGTGGFGGLLELDAGETPFQVATADMNEDGHLDLVVGHLFDVIHIFPGRGDGTFASFIRAEGMDGAIFAVGDVDGDGHLDLIAKAIGAAPPEILYGDGNGGFPEFQTFGFGAMTAIATFAPTDLNGDGLTDLLAAGLLIEVSGTTTINHTIIAKLRNP